MNHYSVGSWSFHGLFHAGKMNLFGYLETMKYRYRLQHADIWNGMLLSTETPYIQSIADTLQEEEMKVACLSVDAADVWHDDPAIRERSHERALTYLAIARSWGVDTLRIDMGVNTISMSDEQLEFLANRYRQYASIASDYGFRVGPQTHQLGSQSPANLRRLNDAVASDAFGIVLNVNRWEVDGERGDEIVAPFTMHAQFDRAFVDFTGAQLQQKVQLLKDKGYEGCWSLEYRGGSNEYLEVEHDLLTIRRAVRQA